MLLLDRKSRVMLLTALGAAASPHLARADFYLHGWQNEHDTQRELRFTVAAGYYSTKNNFDGTGSLILPSGLEKYTRIQSDLTASYGFSPRFSAYTRLGWARALLDVKSGSSSNFGFTDSSLGLSFRAFDFSNPSKPDAITIDVQLQGDFPLYSNQNLTGPALGDGTVDVTGGFFFNFPIARLRSSLISTTEGVGFTYRTSSYAYAIPWSVGASLTPREDGFVIRLAVLGLTSIGNDPRASGTTATSTAHAQASGGSFISSAINPSLMTIRGEAGYQLGSDLGIVAFASQSVWGQASPNGFYVGAALQAHIGPRNTKDGAKLTPMDYGRSNQGFVNYGAEAKVTRVNDRLNLVKLDKGTQDGVEVGQVYDVFLTKKDGSTGAAIARGHVTSVQSNDAALTIDEYFKEVWIDEGFVARRPVQ